MKIKRDSWWYKIYDFNTELPTVWINYHHPENLCYFMRVVLFWVPLKLLILVSTSLLVLATTVLILGKFYMNWVVGYWILVVFCMALPIHTYLNQFQRRTKKVSTKVLLPSPFTEWIKAKKQKICPFIEFIDEP